VPYYSPANPNGPNAIGKLAGIAGAAESPAAGIASRAIGALGWLSLAASLMDLASPFVWAWLRGGWKGEGAQQGSGTSPFSGGQSPGVLYDVSTYATYPSDILGGRTDHRIDGVIGPVLGLGPSPDSGYTTSLYIHTGSGYYGAIYQTYNDNKPFQAYGIEGISRADGQPDTGGNPASIFTATPYPVQQQNPRETPTPDSSSRAYPPTAYNPFAPPLPAPPHVYPPSPGITPFSPPVVTSPPGEGDPGIDPRPIVDPVPVDPPIYTYPTPRPQPPAPPGPSPIPGIGLDFIISALEFLIDCCLKEQSQQPINICAEPCVQELQSEVDAILDRVLDLQPQLPIDICSEPCIVQMQSDLDKVKDDVAEILELLKHPQPELELIELPYVQCMEVGEGHQAQQNFYQLAVPEGSVPLADRELFVDSATLAILGCQDEAFTQDPEQYIRDRANQIYQQSGNQIVSRPQQYKSITNLLLDTIAVSFVRSGQWKFPSEVKETIIKSGDPKFDDLFPAGQSRTLNDAQDYQQWLLEQLDAVLGHWHQVVEIQDNDLEQSGEQSQKIVLTNVAESITELLSQLVVANVGVKALLNMGSRTLIESSAGKKEAIVNQKLLDAIIDYLGFPSKDTVLEVPILCTLKSANDNASEAELRQLESLSSFLEHSVKKVPITEFSGKTNFQEALSDLLNAAAVIRGVLTRKLPTNPDAAKQQLKEQIKEAAKSGEDFDTYLEKVERGFIDSAGISDTSQPYGRSFEQRPKIKEIGKKEDK
jgi:hypothetical protein